MSNYERFRNRVLYPISAVFFIAGLYIAWFRSIYYYGHPITFFVVMALVVAGMSIASYKPKK